MANHTNRDILFKNLEINRHVGGTGKPQLQSSNQHIYEQTRVLDGNNYKLPPNNRYMTNLQSSNPMQLSQNYQNMNNSSNNYKNLLDQSYSGGNGNNNSIDIRGSIEERFGGSSKMSDKQDVYLRKDQDRYDPYNGYLYNRGLLNDGHQFRRYVSSFINIDSSLRTKNPSVVTEKPIVLDKNPLEFRNNSNLMIIQHPNHGFRQGDRITITQAFGTFATLSSWRSTQATFSITTSVKLPAFESPVNCTIMKIYYNHGIPLSYRGNNIQVKIDGIRGDRGSPSSSTLSYYGSIPVNLINATHTVYLTFPGDFSERCFFSVEEGYLTPSAEYFFITLPITQTIETIPLPAPPLPSYNFTLKFTSIAGIPLNLINADYPISQNNLNGYQVLQSATEDTYTIKLPITAITDEPVITGGGNCVTVALITELVPAYPNPNNYTISLDKVYDNVVAMRLISSEIPNTSTAIRDASTGRPNNKLYWNDIDDGDYLYSIEVPAGDYSPKQLANTITELVLKVPRINSCYVLPGNTGTFSYCPEVPTGPTCPAGVTGSTIGTYTPNHVMRTIIDEKTNIVSFEMFKEYIIDKPIFDISPVVPTNPYLGPDPPGPYYIGINSPDNNIMPLCETIIIANAVSTFGIPASVINGEHKIYSFIERPDGTFYFTIQLPYFNLLNNRTNTGGGVNVKLYVPDTFRMFFNQSDTLGVPLGFRNVGETTSITDYRSIITNTQPYANEPSENSLGQPITIKNNALQLSGDPYIIMVADPLETYYSLGPIKDAFAKIQLCDIPGTILYNSFVPINKYYDDPLNELYQLQISFYSPDGYLFDFNGAEHSFTIEIISIADIPEGTGINADTGKNYNQKI